MTIRNAQSDTEPDMTDIEADRFWLPSTARPSANRYTPTRPMHTAVPRLSRPRSGAWRTAITTAITPMASDA